ncbi:MAG: hypothetical protein OHK0037_27330 [Elainellaceae cyanobacterium]
MRRSPATPSQSSPSIPLHPALQAIFENLDLRLEDELTRYRRQQGRRGIAPASRRDFRAAPQPAPQPAPELLATPWDDAPDYDDSPRYAAEVRPHLQLAPERSAGSARALPQMEYVPEPPSYPRLAVSGAIAPRMAPTAAAPGAVPLHRQDGHDLSPVPDSDAEPDDYLESSEHLLRNLAEDEYDLRASQQEPGMLQSLLTPLGIGSMILLLLSSLSFGYLVMNPAGLGVIGLGGASRTTADGSVPGTADPEGALSAEVGPTSSGISPDLSAQEFPEVSLDTLSTLPSGRNAILNEPSAEADPADESPVLSGSPLPAEAPATEAPVEPSSAQPAATTQSAARTASSSPARSQTSASRPRSESRSSATTAAAPAARSSPASRATEPASRPSPSAEPAAPQEVATAPRQPAIAPTPAAASANRYYVVVDFSGDRSLEQAREVVGDAWVRNFDNGAKIQLGVFGDAASARDLAASLQQQGLPAQVYQP